MSITQTSNQNSANNKFDALMEIKNDNVEVKITLENFGIIDSQSEADLLQSILV